MAKKRSLIVLAIIYGALGLVSRSAMAETMDVGHLIEAGELAYKQADFATAEKDFTDAISQLHEADKDARLGTCLNDLGLVYEAQVKKDLALETYKKAVAAKQAATSTTDIALAPLLNNLALLERTMHKYDDAETDYKRVVSIREVAQGADAADVATALNNLAGIYREQ
jgi:tetratricopeptide (TPR) repeat protein